MPTAPQRRPRRAARKPSPARTTSLTDDVYQLLKWKILSMEFGPGALLNEQSLADAIGYGRAPVHQALHRLEYDGLVEIRPRKGVQVRVWSPAEIESLLETRTLIEAQTARLAAQRARPGEAGSLAARLEAGPALPDAPDREALMRLDNEFHRSVAEFARSPMLAEMVGLLHQRSALFWYLPYSGPSQYADVIAEHRAVVEAIRARDPDAAAAAMTAHLSGLTRHYGTRTG